MSIGPPLHHDPKTCPNCIEVVKITSRLLSENDIEAVAERTAALVIERLHPSVRNPPPEEPGTYAPPAPSPYQPRLDDPPQPPAPITDGQRRAFYGKLNTLMQVKRMTNKEHAKLGCLAAVEEEFERPFVSVNDMTSAEASWLLDHMDSRIRKASE